MWILKGIIVHFLLLGSIFVIYFRSPIIKGLQPQNTINLEAPAKRLVLIVTDGLRAESFFRNNCHDIPHIRELFKEQGLVGVSHTRVPTESRPGHIALIAGFYEDPSAVTRGWKENPIDFDTVFNRSSHTYAWGANDILHIFARLSNRGADFLFQAYNDELDFSGKNKTHELDEWVFERAKLLLQRKGKDILQQRQVIFFLHLLGLDTAGHVYKPGTELFLKNLNHTEYGIWKIYNDFESTFPDRRTAYILTSDHGMTNAGSHGAGDKFETETPFFLWGAGINNKLEEVPADTFKAQSNLTLPLYSLEQAQFAPFMSALIGIPPPVNNFGILPASFLNASLEYKLRATHVNALQLLEQFRVLRRDNERGIFSFFLRHFNELDEKKCMHYKQTFDQKIKKLQNQVDGQEILQASQSIMRSALQGIEFYHNYYRNALLLSTAATFLGWIVYLLQLLLIKPQARGMQNSASLLYLYAIAVTIFGLLQLVPVVITFYLILPAYVWGLVAKNGITLLFKSHSLPWKQLILMILYAELLVGAFFYRQMISLVFFLYAVTNTHPISIIYQFKSRFYALHCLNLFLIMFPLFPPSVGYENTFLLLIGLGVLAARVFLVKSQLSTTTKLASLIVNCNALICIYRRNNLLGNFVISQLISWSYLFYAFLSIILRSPDKTLLKKRIELIQFNLFSIYALFCTSYELLFAVLLAAQLILSLAAQQMQMVLNFNVNSIPQQLKFSFSLAFAILLYTFFSFFGTGNIASVSSFDPNITRCFLTKFSPFLIMTLVILKLIIPVLVNVSIIFGTSKHARLYEYQIFICLLLICDIMGLNFLFLVKNYGSWLEIGSSISHFVIMEVTTLALFLITYLAKLLLRLPPFGKDELMND